VLIARLLPLARTFVSLPAGARHVRLLPFVALTTIGCALWAAALVLTGLLAGARLGLLLIGRPKGAPAARRGDDSYHADPIVRSAWIAAIAWSPTQS
jgi:hypothetical protein